MSITSPGVELKCPYCNEVLFSNRELRVHVGSVHQEKIDDFTEKYYSGRWIEVDFITLMLQRAVSDRTDEFCQECDECTPGCSISQVLEDFKPYQIISLLNKGDVKGLLKSDILWKCTTCLSCIEACPEDISPYEVISILRNLSARIGFHFPRFYKDLDRRVFRTGMIQEPKKVPTSDGEMISRSELGLPPIMEPFDKEKFASALNELASRRELL